MENSSEQTPDLSQPTRDQETERSISEITGNHDAGSVAPIAPVSKRTGTKKLAFVLGGLIVLVLGGVGAYVVLSKSGIVKTNQPVASSTAKSTTPAASSSSATPASSTDSAIANDLQSADASLSQSSSDQSNSDSALNDASQQITVPTN